MGILCEFPNTETLVFLRVMFHLIYYTGTMLFAFEIFVLHILHCLLTDENIKILQIHAMCLYYVIVISIMIVFKKFKSIIPIFQIRQNANNQFLRSVKHFFRD